MQIDWTFIIFILLVIDSVGAVLLSWCGARWWRLHLGIFSKYFPPAKGWSALYLFLVLVIGSLLGFY